MVFRYKHLGIDILTTLKEQPVGYGGMKIDRMMFERFADTVREDDAVKKAVEAGQWDHVIDYVNREVFDKPEEYYTLDKLRKAAAVDRRLSLREILEKVFDLIPGFKSKDELLEEEFNKFVADYEPANPKSILPIKNYFKAYATDNWTRCIVDSRDFGSLATNPIFSSEDFRRRAREVPGPRPRIHQGLRLAEPVRSIEVIAMLDTVTKRRIDTARDILVGKVPDPKSQVEQITIALIYKFMDDIDAESEELGGKRQVLCRWLRPLRVGQSDAPRHWRARNAQPVRRGDHQDA